MTNDICHKHGLTLTDLFTSYMCNIINGLYVLKKSPNSYWSTYCHHLNKVQLVLFQFILIIKKFNIVWAPMTLKVSSPIVFCTFYGNWCCIIFVNWCSLTFYKYFSLCVKLAYLFIKACMTHQWWFLVSLFDISHDREVSKWLSNMHINTYMYKCT